MSHIADESSPNGAIFKRMLDSIEAGNQAMALEIAEELVNENKEAFFPYLMRAVAYCYMKEDGKALKDWMTSISLMEKNEKMDAYVCIISKSVSDLIIADEREFVDFDYLSHIDRVCETLDEHLECNCKGFVYLTVFTCFMSSYLGMEEDEKEQCGEIIPNLVQRTVAYSRDVSVIKDVVNECLGINDYDESTYEEDDNYDLYALSKIVEKIEKNLHPSLRRRRQASREVRQEERHDDRARPRHRGLFQEIPSHQMKPRPSRRTFSPITIRMTPPRTSAFFPNLSPNRLPILTPAIEMTSVTSPIIKAGKNMLSSVMANDIPIARASMLVAIASRTIVLTPMSASTSSSSPNSPSRTMFAPIRNRRKNATQWS